MEDEGCGCLFVVFLIIFAIILFGSTKGCKKIDSPPPPQAQQTSPSTAFNPPPPNAYGDIHFDVDKPIEANPVTSNIWEMDCYFPFDNTSWYWCYKSSLANFQNKHPNDKITVITPSVYMYIQVGSSMIPLKVFIITEPIPLPAPEIKAIPSELK
jgi:hypothetical protein